MQLQELQSRCDEEVMMCEASLEAAKKLQEAVKVKSQQLLSLLCSAGYVIREGAKARHGEEVKQTLASPGEPKDYCKLP